MDNFEFDNCPKCGAEPQFGLRSHPKFMTCYERPTNNRSNIGIAYFRTEEENDEFASREATITIYKQKWDHDKRRWVEYD